MLRISTSYGIAYWLSASLLAEMVHDPRASRMFPAGVACSKRETAASCYVRPERPIVVLNEIIVVS